jgi:alpha-N-arabinofuranosidase
VFDLYKVHQDATYLNSSLKTEDYEFLGDKLPALNVSASKSEDGTVNISIVNINPDKDIDLVCEIRGADVKDVTGKILTAPTLDAHNTFDQPNNVRLADFTKMKLKNNVVELKVPAKSVLVLRLK